MSTEHEETTIPKEKILAYLMGLACEMGLSGWRFNISDDPPDNPDAGADIGCPAERHEAVVRLAPDFGTLDEEKIRHILTHELVHCHLAGMLWTIAGTEGVLGKKAYALLYDNFIRQDEIATDNIAAHWAPLLPLISQMADIPESELEALRER